MLTHESTDLPVGESKRSSWWSHLYVQVLIGVSLGILIGAVWPSHGAALKPLGDAFIKLVKMIISPVVFLTITTGIATAGALGTVGRTAARALIYFLTFSTLALLLGWAVAEIFTPGAGLNVPIASLDPAATAEYGAKAHEQGLVAFLLGIIPETLFSALTGGSILQVLFIAVLTGVGFALVGEPAAPIVDLLERASEVVFRIVALLMRLAPIGAFGAMAYTIGAHGPRALLNLAGLVGLFYLTAFLFVVVVLGLVARYNGFSIFALLKYLRTELVLVLGTSSSESALPRLIMKMEAAGCPKSTAGLVVPLGYSFNLDGTNIYLTLAALFIAQATNVHLSWEQELALLAVAMVSSKGAAGVTGGGFVTLAATLSIVPSVPLAGIALILGIDRFMSECRSLTNFIGNAVAVVVVSRWEGGLDRVKLRKALHGETADPPDAPD